MAVEEDLLAAIARDPEDPAAYLVYADHLQGRGELRGELMALQQATEERPGDHRISDAALDHVRAHARFYLGELAPFVDDHEYLQLGWRCGFIGSAVLTWNRRGGGARTRFEVSPARVLASLLQLPSARFLTRLVVEPTEALDARFIGEVIAAHAPPSLRELWIGPRDPQSALRDCELGDLTIRSPHLRELRIHGNIGRLELDLPRLRSATLLLHGEALTLDEDLVAARWPALERCHVWSAPTLTSLAGFLRRTDLPLLGDLGVINVAFADPACRLLARSPLAPQLFRLSLARSTLTNAGIDELLAGELVSLATVDVSETFVGAAGVARLRSLASEVVAHELRTGRPCVYIPPLRRDLDT